MSAPEFFDTNVLVCAYDPSDQREQRTAQERVLAEFAATLLHKLSPAARPAEVKAALDALAPLRVVAPDGEMVRRAVEARTEYRLHFYDGMIVAAAERAGCTRIWSEDLNAGQKYFGVAVENPFG